MSDELGRYLRSLATLREFLDDHLSGHEEEDPAYHATTCLRWRGFRVQDAVETLAGLAAAINVPPAVKLAECPKELFPRIDPATLPGHTPGAPWRVMGIKIFDPMMKAFLLPMVYEEGVPDGWVVRGPLEPVFDTWEARHKFCTDCTFAIRQWEDDLTTPPGPGGVPDTPGGRETWEQHCDHWRRKEVSQLFALRGVKNMSDPRLDPAARLKLRGEAEAIFAKYERAKITAHFLKRGIENYLSSLDHLYFSPTAISLNAARKKGGRPTSPTPTDLKVIADWVHHYFRMAVPLDFDGAPDIPDAPAMEPRAAYALLGKLRQCCIGRMKETGDDRWRGKTDAAGEVETGSGDGENHGAVAANRKGRSEKPIPPCVARAHSQYVEAVSNFPDLARKSPREAYPYIKQMAAKSGEELPDIGSWLRYVRAGQSAARDAGARDADKNG